MPNTTAAMTCDLFLQKLQFLKGSSFRDVALSVGAADGPSWVSAAPGHAYNYNAAIGDVVIVAGSEVGFQLFLGSLCLTVCCSCCLS